MPEARIYDPRLPRLSRLGQGRRDRRIFLSWPGFSRFRGSQGGEQTQTGLESFGRRDAEAADAEVFSLAMEAAAAAGGAMLTARLGDAGLFEAVLESLKIPEPWRRRLRRGVARGLSLEAIFSRPSQSALAQPGVLAALESADHAGAKALVEDLLAIAGIDAVGGRTPGEIADRFLEQASLQVRAADRGREAGGAGRFSGDFRRSRSGGHRAAPPGAFRRPQLERGAGGVRAAQRLHRRPWRRDRGDPIQRRLRARFRLLHRLCVRGPRSPFSGLREPRSQAGATTASRGASARLHDIPAVGAAINLDRLMNGGER